MIGQLLDRRYRIVRVLGAGGFGQTYVAEDTRIPGNPTCVVKQLKPASNSPNILQMARQLFDREAKTLAELGNHQQIPRLLAYFEENQEFYLVQEFIDGRTLGTELPPGKRWSESEVIQLLQEILSILEFVHKHGVIHRDIKPDNIIRRTSDNSLFLIDFGAIKEVQTQQISAAGSSPATGTRIGTPGYMPTEQARGKPRPNSDIYALGMVGIQALTGTYPHLLEEDNEGEIIWQHQAQVRQELEAVLNQMVCYHFKDRYQTATEALQAVQKLANPTYQATAPVTAATTAVQELTLKWMEAGLLKTQTISENQPSKNPGTVRIGRDTRTCDIVLSEPSVSGLHVEIFFNPQQQCFYLRNLRQSNPPIVDGKSLLTGEVAISQGSTLRLGQLDLRVSAIALQQHPAGYTPTNYVTQPISTPQPRVPPTVQPQGTTPDRGLSQQSSQTTLSSEPGGSPQKISAHSYAGSLKSAVGMDYTPLRDLLAAGQWEEADNETARVMLNVGGGEQKGWLDKNSIKNFPCDDLGTINQLWLDYSNGRFGFSVQKQIWLTCGGKINLYSECKLGDSVGWRVNSYWIEYRKIKFSLDAPPGHLPVRVYEMLYSRVVLFSRVQICHL